MAFYAAQSIANLVNGADRAQNHLVECIVACGKVSGDDAVKVAAVYKKLKLVKFDAIHGTSHIKHGVFFEAHAIANALAYANDKGIAA